MTEEEIADCEFFGAKYRILEEENIRLREILAASLLGDKAFAQIKDRIDIPRFVAAEILAMGLSNCLAEHPNYIEVGFKPLVGDKSRPAFTVTICRHRGETPANRAARFELENKTLKETLSLREHELKVLNDEIVRLEGVIGNALT